MVKLTEMIEEIMASTTERYIVIDPIRKEVFKSNRKDFLVRFNYPEQAKVYYAEGKNQAALAGLILNTNRAWALLAIARF